MIEIRVPKLRQDLRSSWLRFGTSGSHPKPEFLETCLSSKTDLFAGPKVCRSEGPHIAAEAWESAKIAGTKQVEVEPGSSGSDLHL